MPIQKLTPEIITAAILGFEEQKRHIDSKIAELRAMLPGGPGETAATPEAPTRKRRKFSAAARRRMREAQQRRWASIRGNLNRQRRPRRQHRSPNGNSVRLAEKQFKMPYGVGGRKRGPKLQRRNLPAPRRPPGKTQLPKRRRQKHQHQRRPRSRARLLYRLWRNLPVKGKRGGRIAIFLPAPCTGPLQRV